MTPASEDAHENQHPHHRGLFGQPIAVWAIAFATMVSFMGIGLVDPILPTISAELNATPGETMLLFTSYLLVTAVAMFFAGFISSRLGIRKTLLVGLLLIVAFAAAAGLAGSVDQIIGFRAGWGLGNALFVSTALAAIVGVASGGSGRAVILFEASLGIGLAVGPLLGGALGELSWRGPFLGTAALMAIGFIVILTLLPKSPNPPDPVPFTAGILALRDPALRTLAIAALFYNFGFFTLLAYSPYPLEAAAKLVGSHFGARELGWVFFGWGLALAIASVFVAPILTRIFGVLPVLFTMLALLIGTLAFMAANVTTLAALVTAIVVSGVFLGILNTALTETVMEATSLPRNVASSTYSGMRFLGGAIAPAVSGPVAELLGAGAPYWLGSGTVVIAIVVLIFGRRRLSDVGDLS